MLYGLHSIPDITVHAEFSVRTIHAISWAHRLNDKEENNSCYKYEALLFHARLSMAQRSHDYARRQKLG